MVTMLLIFALVKIGLLSLRDFDFNKGERKVIFLHGNARPHIAKTTRERKENLTWEVLPHPAYLPDFAFVPVNGTFLLE